MAEGAGEEHDCHDVEDGTERETLARARGICREIANLRRLNLWSRHSFASEALRKGS